MKRSFEVLIEESFSWGRFVAHAVDAEKTFIITSGTFQNTPQEAVESLRFWFNDFLKTSKDKFVQVGGEAL